MQQIKLIATSAALFLEGGLEKLLRLGKTAVLVVATFGAVWLLFEVFWGEDNIRKAKTAGALLMNIGKFAVASFCVVLALDIIGVHVFGTGMCNLSLEIVEIGGACP